MIRIITIAVVLALTGTACGDDEAPSANGSDADEVLTLGAEDLTFMPATLEATPGASIEVRFENNDSVTHTFTIADLDVDLEVGDGEADTVSFTAPSEGSVGFVCRIHPAMTGELTVSGGAGGDAPGDDDDTDTGDTNDNGGLYDY